MTADHHTGGRSPGGERSWTRLEVGCQRALPHHFAGSPLVEAAPVDAPVRWVRTGVASNIHNGVVRNRSNADGADVVIVQGCGPWPAVPRSGTSTSETIWRDG